MIRLACAVLGLAMMAGCGDGSDGDAGDGGGTPASLDGSWGGTITQGGNPPAAIGMGITQTGDAISGTYNGTGGTTGTMTGSVSGDTVNMTTTVGAVVAQWTGTLNAEHTAMSGTFTIVAGGGGSGTWTLNQ